MKYLICWGAAVKQIRVGEGRDKVEAARDAFGSSDLSRMTFQEVKAQDIRTDYRRTKLCYNLLEAHKTTMKNLVGHGLLTSELYKITADAEEVRRELSRHNGSAWARMERRGKVL